MGIKGDFMLGDKVIFDGDGTKPRLKNRLYGLVVKVGPTRLTIETADGERHVREPAKVARYTVAPKNWADLYRGIMRLSPVRESSAL